MKKRIEIIECAMYLAGMAAIADDAPATQKTFYRCTEGYEPPCRKVAEVPTPSTAAGPDWHELIAASRAYRSKDETPVLRDSMGPIPQCGGAHGQSACCKIVGKLPDGDVIIECGR